MFSHPIKTTHSRQRRRVPEFTSTAGGIWFVIPFSPLYESLLELAKARTINDSTRSGCRTLVHPDLGGRIRARNTTTDAIRNSQAGAREFPCSIQHA